MNTAETFEQYTSSLIHFPIHGPISIKRLKELLIGLSNGFNVNFPTAFQPGMHSLPVDFLDGAGEMGWLAIDHRTNMAVITKLGIKTAKMAIAILNKDN